MFDYVAARVREKNVYIISRFVGPLWGSMPPDFSCGVGRQKHVEADHNTPSGKVLFGSQWGSVVEGGYERPEAVQLAHGHEVAVDVIHVAKDWMLGVNLLSHPCVLSNFVISFVDRTIAVILPKAGWSFT